MSIAKRFCVLGLVLLFASAARAELKVVSQWRLGEDDGDVGAGAEVKETVDAGDAKRTLPGIASPTYSDNAAAQFPRSKRSIHFDGQAQLLQRQGLADLGENYVAEAFARADSEEGFHVVLQYGSAAHGWSIIRNNKGYQVLLGGVALLGWSGDVPKGQWVHVALVRQKGVTTFYFNGQPAGESNAKLNAADANSTFSIGGNNEKHDLFVGEIDEARVATFPPGGFDPSMLELNDPDGTNAAKVLAPTAPAPTAAAPGGPAAPEGAPAGEAASIVFDAEPVETKMTFDRGSLKPENIETENGTKAAWTAQQGSAPDVPWARSVLIKLTDPALREGKSPVVDVEVEFRQTFDSPVELRADTAAGSRIVGGSWGRDNRWKTFVAHIDDAYFGARQFNNKPSDMHTDGYDLRINSFGSDFSVRSIRVRPFDLKDKPDYKRLIKFGGVQTPGDLLLCTPGSKRDVSYLFSNLASAKAELGYRHEVVDRAGKTIAEKSGKLSLDARSDGAVAINFDTAGLARGVYTTHLVLTSPEGENVFDRRGGFAVADDSPIARAEPGDFLYGLDVQLGPAYNSPKLLRWAQFMGADLIRHGFGFNDDLEEITQHLPTYEKAGLGVMLMCDPPKTQNPDERTAQLAKKVDYLKTVASRLPQIKFYELGNEPDLTFFYPGPIENYAEDFGVMSDAIRAGNPNAVVLNGGLAFAGAESTARAKRFVEIVDPAKLGAWSYHGHGPGAAAESSALERIRDLARAAGKLKTFADTETGVAAQTPAQEAVQSRTVVQKMVYAQSQKLPFLMFFRLLMFEEAYGMLYSEQEPRPAVVAYSNLVRQLRGLKFDSTLDQLPTGASGYRFAGKGKRACVLWSDSAGEQQVQLKISPATAKVQRIDLFGNATDLKPASDGSLVVALSADPIYLVWPSKDAAGGLAVTPGVLTGGSEVVVRSSGSDKLPVTLVAPAGIAVKGTLRFTPGPDAHVTLPKSEIEVNVAAGKTSTISVPVEVQSADDATLVWPRQWTAFVGVDESKLDLAALTAAPATLEGRSGTVSPQIVILQNDRIDFERIGGTLREREPAVVFASVESDRDQDVKIGASADWWMEWVVNGKTAYSTLDRGNGGGYSVSDHVFTLPLKKGTNFVAAKVLSGSMGWKLLVGSPERMASLGGDSQSRGIRVELVQAGRATETRSITLRRSPPMEAWAIAGAESSLSDWQSVQPDFVLLDHVTNNFAKLPDATKWWQGAKDLSARGWVRTRDGKLMVVIAVDDDVDHPAPAEKPEDGDAMRLRIRTNAGTAATIDVTAASGGSAAARSSDASIKAIAHVTRTGGTTLYQIELAAAKDTARPEAIDVIAFDADDVIAKQHVSLTSEIGDGKTPSFDGAYRLLWPVGK